MATWFWQNHSEWKPYSKEENEKLEKAYNAEKSTVKINADYQVNLEEMCQFKIADPSRRRKVKRETEESDESESDEEPAAKKRKGATTTRSMSKPKAPKASTSTRASTSRKRKKEEVDEESDESSEDEEQSEEDESGSEEESSESKAKGTWRVVSGCLVFEPEETSSSDRIVGFDFDSTLVVTKSGRKFATSADDWKLFDKSVPAKLKELYEEGYKLVIFTNQGGVAKGKMTRKSIEQRIEGFMAAAKVPMYVFAAINEDHNRKPSPAMWTMMVTKFNGDINNEEQLDKTDCFYVGDAAGRPATATVSKKKDFSASDYKFALNAGIDFKTPEELFLGHKPFKRELALLGFDPRKLKQTIEASDKKPYDSSKLISTEQEIVVFVGLPASGKSSFARRHFVANGYVHINRDTLKTKEKCIKAAQEAVEEGKSVVVDNTSPSPSDRKPYIDIANDAGIKIRCFHFTTSEELAKHMNMVRERITNGDHKHVPRVAYNMFKKNFKEPTNKEGFSSITKIDFIPDFTGNEALERTFYQFTETS